MASRPLPVPDNPLTRLADPKRYGPVLGFVLTPLALTGYVMAAWRLGADLDWLGEFFISNGLLSRWQVWLALAAAAHVAARRLNESAAREPSATPPAGA